MEPETTYKKKKIMLEHPNPIHTSGDFTGLWISYARISVSGQLVVSAAHFNGAQTLGDSETSVHRAANVTAINEAVVAEVTRLTGRTGLKVVSVNAPSPSKPISIVCSFDGEAPHVIRDARALAATDSTFAAAFTSIMSQIGTLINQ
jgi:hypothetical protein